VRAALLAFGCAACTVQAPPPATPAPRPGPTTAAAPAPAAEPAPAPAAGLTPHGPVECRGNEYVELVGVSIQTAGTAIDAHGNCSVRISGSHIAGDVALDAHGNAHVEIEDSTLEGGRVAVDLHGNAMLTTRGSTFAGGIDRHGNAALEDLGGNRW
jgi:hypothetical protein